MADPDHESHLQAQLALGAERAERLIALLDEEHAALVEGAPQRIVDAARVKQPLIEELERIGAQLDEALRVLGLDGASLEPQRLRAGDGPLTATLRRLLLALRTCRHANARNGATIRRLARHNHHLLALVRGEAPGTALYDHDGRAQSGPKSRYAASA